MEFGTPSASCTCVTTARSSRSSSLPGTALWNSHRDIGLWERKTDLPSSKRRTHLDLLLQCSHWESLHDGPGWLRLHLHLLAEGHPHTGLGGWLHSGLDAAEAWDGEHTGHLHLLRSNGSQALEDQGHLLVLQAVLSGDVLDHGTLGHGLVATGSLHGLGLHRLHGGHGTSE